MTENIVKTKRLFSEIKPLKTENEVSYFTVSNIIMCFSYLLKNDETGELSARKINDYEHETLCNAAQRFFNKISY